MRVYTIHPFLQIRLQIPLHHATETLDHMRDIGSIASLYRSRVGTEWRVNHGIDDEVRNRGPPRVASKLVGLDDLFSRNDDLLRSQGAIHMGNARAKHSCIAIDIG